MKIPQSLFNTGITQACSVQDTKNIRTVNIVSIITAFFAVTGTWIAYTLVIKDKQILYAGIIEGIAFAIVILLNRVHQYKSATFLFYILQNAAVIYFGVKLDNDSGITQVGFFMVGLSFLLFKKWFERLSCVIITASALIFIEANHRMGFIHPFEIIKSSAFPIRVIVFPIGLALNTLVIVLYETSYNGLMKIIEQNNIRLKRADLSKSIYIRETSHELRQPVNAMFGISQILLEASPGQAIGQYRHFIEALFAAGNQALRVINNVLEMAKIEEGKIEECKPEIFSFRTFVTEIITANQYFAQVYSAEIRIIIDRFMPDYIYADKNKISQVFTNLIANAIKFGTTHNATNIIIVKTEYLNPRHWQFSVTDNGEGIPEDKINTIFEPFVSEGNSNNSTGLGLPITRKLVSVMGGNINVTSVMGEGTTFTVDLPLTKIDVRSIGASEYPTDESKLSSLNVLLIEDDRLNINICRHFFAQCNSLLIAQSGKEGLEMARKHIPDIILLDYNLPDMAGKDVIVALKQDNELQQIPVIIVSGDAFAERQHEMLDLGATEYIIKPFTFAALRQAMARSIS